jgi:Ca2+-binding EF-hand superfamily protein
MRGMSSAASIQERAAFCFNIYDRDKGGTITKDELKAIVRCSLEESGMVRPLAAKFAKMADQIWSRMDTNCDGHVNFEEFLAETRRDPSVTGCVSLDVPALLAFHT